MSPENTLPKSEDCNCLAARQAARHVTQFYDLIMAPAGLRTSQFSLLAKLQRLGPLSINALAAEMVMDRTTLGRTIRPLVRDGFIVVTKKPRTAAANNFA
jgi:DNA-binding MarR family transcriptional regulator